MIQFNLLPEVKLEYIKASHLKRLTIGIALIAGSFCALVFTALFINVTYLQTRHIDNLSNNIAQDFNKIKSSEDISKILTVQKQLNSLTGLHEKSPAADRFQRYLSQLTPQKVSISSAGVQYPEKTIKIVGTADTLATINKFTDVLKFTKYSIDKKNQDKSAFTEVVLTSFGVSNDKATYQLSLKFNPDIFDNTKAIELTVPNIISTRSNVERPTGLFQPQPVKEDTNNLLLQ